MATATPPETAGSAGWKSYFVLVDGSDKARKKCTLCGVVLDVRAGRARKHLEKSHGQVGGQTGSGSPAPETTGKGPPPTRPENPHPRGSREWGIEWLREIIDAPESTREVRLKALAEIREWESYEGTGSFDDIAELEKHLEQWDRVAARAKELRELSKKILRDPTTRADLLRQMTEIGG